MSNTFTYKDKIFTCEDGNKELTLEIDNFGDGNGFVPDFKIWENSSTQEMYFFFDTLDIAKEFHKKFGQIIEECERLNKKL